MTERERQIAEMVGKLPQFIGKMFSGFEVSLKAELNGSEIKTLMFLHRTEGKPMKEYSKMVGLARGSFTTVADKLVEKGYVKRASVAGDRRQYLLVLTKKGTEAAQTVISEHEKHISEKISKLRAEDQEALVNALELILSVEQKL